MLKSVLSRTMGSSKCSTEIAIFAFRHFRVRDVNLLSDVSKSLRRGYHFKAAIRSTKQSLLAKPEGTCRCWSYQLQCRCISSSRVVEFAKEVQLDEDEVFGKGDKVVKVRLGTTRLEAILKAGLNISRSKIEKAFYDDRIRVNGERPKKKSVMLDEGDEVDIVRGINKKNPLFLDISRVEIIEIGTSGATSTGGKNKRDSDDEESDDEDTGSRTPMTLKRFKNYTIQNYSTPWKGNVAE